MTKPLAFDEEEWNAAMQNTVAEMTSYLWNFRAPIYEDKGTHGVGEGSGSYLQLDEQVFLLTNEHVAADREGGKKLIYQFAGQEDLRPFIGNHVTFGAPLDLALMPVDQKAWQEASNQSRAIQLDQIAWAHVPVPGEVFSFVGFAGDGVDFHFGALTSTATCSTAREVGLPKDDQRISPRFHFGLDYNPNLATDVIGKKGLPRPPGLSGSTVWNTCLVEAKMAGRQWTPDLAKVTGVVWGWPSNVGCLVATRSEYLRSFLLDARQKLDDEMSQIRKE